MKTPRIGILTGGGDVPGLNSVIKSVVYRATDLGQEVLGIRKGWQGLTHARISRARDDQWILPLTRENTRSIDRTGGTFLHTSRHNPVKTKESDLPEHLPAGRQEALRAADGNYDLTPVIVGNLEELGIGTLIVIGGDGTLGYAAHLSRSGWPIIGIPKTMDNDVPGTEYCIGFSTAINRAKELITRQRTTLGSHERVAVFRIFGRQAGFTALYTGYVTSTRCLIPECPFDLDEVCRLMVEDKYNNPSRYSLIVISEGASWLGRQTDTIAGSGVSSHARPGDVGQALAAEIQRRTGETTMSSDLSYDLRSGEPDALDRIIATTFANIAMELISEGISNRMLSIQGGRYCHTGFPAPGSPARRVDVEKLYNRARFRPRYDSKLGSPVLLDEVRSG